MKPFPIESLGKHLILPDPWQQEALHHLQDGHDVVVSAPTGAGKTFIFERFLQGGFRGRAVFTVPTRALANDKLFEWRDAGWNVGIMTGDISHNTEAPVVVATLETQRNPLIRGEGPDLLVIDEYQMLSDPHRGVNYEIAIALAPAKTQLLLLSGSVGNPGKVVEWLRRIGRKAFLVDHRERPVPQEEVFFDALPDRVPRRIHGFWVRRLARALAADLGPILIFAPLRRASEELARQLSSVLPTEDPLTLTPEQRRLAGPTLTRLLKNRVVYHHSGLSYQQRAGLIEPLAKAGQLRAVVATTGLAAGINFCMRSVVVTDREYRIDERNLLIRPDELLQMFGRAGRRGLDERGTILVAEGKPRLHEAKPLQLRRSNQVDWPVFLSVMRQAILEGKSPELLTRNLLGRLFSDQQIPIGLEEFVLSHTEAPALYRATEDSGGRGRSEVIEMENSMGTWERRPAPRKTRLGEALLFHRGTWHPALSVAETLAGLRIGSVCRLYREGRRYYGREIPLARFPQEENSGQIRLLKWVRQGLRSYFRELPGAGKRKQAPESWDFDTFEKEILPLLPVLTSGGRLVELIENQGLIRARVEYDDAQAFAWIDSHGKALLNPPLRKTLHAPLEELLPFPRRDARIDPAKHPSTPARIWYRLQLINNRGHPTRRGAIFSFFQRGEGLAIAAGLEDLSYPIDDLVWDVANLRAGHRFESAANAGGRLRMVCLRAFGGASFEGYLTRGLPVEYGEGAAELIRNTVDDPASRRKWVDENIRTGDIERVHLEWRSILNHIAHAPAHDWARWTEFQEAVRRQLEHLPSSRILTEMPPMSAAQKTRHLIPLRF